MERSHYQKHKKFSEGARGPLRQGEVPIEPVSDEWKKYVKDYNSQPDDNDEALSITVEQIFTRVNRGVQAEIADDDKHALLIEENQKLKKEN